MTAPDPGRALVGWVSDLLITGWRRQEAEGRYRGGDDFRALHIDPDDALASWHAVGRDPAPWPAELGGSFPASALPGGLGLTSADAYLCILAVAPELEPRLRPLVAALTDDPALRLPTLGLALELAGAVGLNAAELRAAVAPDSRVRFLDLVRLTIQEGRPSLLDAALVASEWLVALGGLPDPAGVRRLGGAESRARSAAPGGWPLVLAGADHVTHAEALPGEVLLATADPASGVGRAVRAALHADAALVLACDDPPDPELVRELDLAAALGCRAAVSLAPGVGWIGPASWARVPCRAPDAGERATRWAERLEATGRAAEAEDLTRVAGEFALGRDAIDEAARRLAASGSEGRAAGLAELRDAARMAVWRDLSTCARRGPVGNGWDDLVVEPAIATQLHDIADAIAMRGRVLDEWGFGQRPGSRGYHVLFAGPSGTGKTMSAGVIAEATGLELWVVDLARVVDKYLGETEKAIDKVLRAAENSGAMLLFDEADALFGRRGEVREAKDRWANVEVAFLLQRIEDHDGVTVLTTNVSHHLDEAFARRMSQRVEFSLPDGPLRRVLWQRSVPVLAPLSDPADLDLVADRFELAGGAIRTAALNAAYEAAAGRRPIALEHLVRAAVRELTKSGRAPTRQDLGPLADLVTDGSGW